MATAVMTAEHRPLYKRLYFQIVCAILIGVAIGALAPQTGESLKWLGDAFVKLIKMMIAPIIFTTVAVGIAKMGDLKEVGRVGIKALLYFEVVTTVALFIGLIVVNVVQPVRG
jgi:aerobic C4-dicarboxylate transport protein